MMRRRDSVPLRWTPTSAQADFLVDMLTARLPHARIAQRLNIDEATLRSYLARLAAAEDFAPRQTAVRRKTVPSSLPRPCAGDRLELKTPAAPERLMRGF